MYTYTATGSRIRKEVIQGSTTTDYLYSGGFVYKDSTLEYLTHQEGRMVEDAQGDFIYQYNISDHLGNVRVSFEATSGDSLTLLQENHYYPFGLVYMGEGQSQIGTVNQYKYQTKELQDEFSLHWYDFGARMYDAQIGRWHVADAASQYYSPYLAMANNPTRMVDPTGLWADFVRTPGSRHYGQNGYAVHQMRKQGSYWNLYSGKFVVNPQDENYKWFAWVLDESNSFKDIADVNDEFGGGSGGSDFRFRILKYKENSCADEFAKNEEKRHKYMQLVEEDPAAAEAFLDEILREIRGAQTGLMNPTSEGGDDDDPEKESNKKAEGFVEETTTAFSFVLSASGMHIGSHMQNVQRFGPLYWNNGAIYRPGSSGYRYWFIDGAKATKLGKGLRIGGGVLGTATTFYSAYNFIKDPTLKGGLDTMFGVIGFFGPFGLGVSVLYFAGDAIIPGGWEATPKHLYNHLQRNTAGDVWDNPVNHFK